MAGQPLHDLDSQLDDSNDDHHRLRPDNDNDPGNDDHNNDDDDVDVRRRSAMRQRVQGRRTRSRLQVLVVRRRGQRRRPLRALRQPHFSSDDRDHDEEEPLQQTTVDFDHLRYALNLQRGNFHGSTVAGIQERSLQLSLSLRHLSLGRILHDR